jgi:hypothetical protein
MNPDTTPVSCPFASGGGEEQWDLLNLFQQHGKCIKLRIAKALGALVQQIHGIQPHAVIATALYMKDLGAAAQTYTTERNAACRYYSGRSCSGSNEFYGNSVMNIATKLQKDIDFLNGQ